MSLSPCLHENFEAFASAKGAGVIGVVMLDVALDRRDALAERWNDLVREGTIADAIVDRIVGYATPSR